MYTNYVFIIYTQVRIIYTQVRIHNAVADCQERETEITEIMRTGIVHSMPPFPTKGVPSKVEVVLIY